MKFFGKKKRDDEPREDVQAVQPPEPVDEQQAPEEPQPSPEFEPEKLEPGVSVEEVYKPITIQKIEELCKADPESILEVNDKFVVVEAFGLKQIVRMSDKEGWIIVQCVYALSGDELPFENTDTTDPEELNSQLHLLIEATNTWNRDRHQPTAYINREDDTWTLHLDSAYYAGSGLSASQFYSALHRAFGTARQAVEEIPTFIPPF
ncbi:MAG: hypothetical protein Q4E01_00790 [Actinomycetaceae bacterium]|nr:hypothetical protein [Actinomycetaceae bacterium]